MYNINLITMCYDETFRELVSKDSEKDEIYYILDRYADSYVFDEYTNLDIKLEKNNGQLFSVSKINYEIDGEHILYKDISYEEVLEIFSKTEKKYHPYINVFKSCDSIKAHDYFGGYIID